ncbi:MAG: universal stress protein [Gemmatimonadetes bacterium]|nr:universal stress protein [Gemmatimonadota bacterium]
MPPTIVLAARLSEQPDPTGAAAARLAAQIQGEIVLVYVAEELDTIPQLHASTGDDADALRQRIMEELNRDIATYIERNLKGASVRVRVTEGAVADEVTRAAAEERAEYLVIGTEARSAISNLILGSTTQDILKRATVPVVVVPAVLRLNM